MSDYLSKDVMAWLEEARRRDRRRRGRLHIQAGADHWPVLRRWEGGFALDARGVAHLRGFVDLYDGPRHLMNCLIVATAVEGDELICTVKSMTPAEDRPPVDFVRDDRAPGGLLPPPATAY